MWKAIYSIVFLVGLSLASCTEPFDARSFTFERVIVVDGLLTDENKFHQLKLTYTYPIGSQSDDGITNADVRLIDSNGRQVFFREQSPGLYQSSLAFAGEVGKSYRLIFTTPDGKTYESNNQLLAASPEIDSIYDDYAVINNESLNEQLEGAQFFLDTHDDTGQARFFRYEWQEDYKILAPFPSRFEYLPDVDSIVLRREQVHQCYLFNTSNEINIANTLGISGNQLIAHPIRFVDLRTDLLRVRYSLSVKQYNIGESAYRFFRKIQESNESGGSLFDRQQGSIPGNIVSLDDPSEIVLGYFEVAGVSEKRAFFNFEDLDERLTRPAYRTDCSFADDVFMSPLDSIPGLITPNSPYRIVSYTPGLGIGSSTVIFVGLRACTDCSWFAPTEPPSYWID